MKESKQQSNVVIYSLKKIIWGAGIMFFGRILGKGIGYFYIMFVARLGAEQYGMLNLGFSIASLLIVLSVLGLDAGILRYVPFYLIKKDKARVKGVLYSAISITSILSLFFFFMMFFFSKQLAINIFHNSSLILIFKIFSLMIPFTALASIFMMSLRAFQRVDYEILNREILEKTARLLFTILLILMGFGVFGASISYVISALTICTVSFFILEKKVFSFLRIKIKPIYFTKELFFYSFPLFLVGILQLTINWADTLMLGYFRTTFEVGLYNAASPTAALMFIMPGALISLFLPIMIQFYTKKKKKEMVKIYDIISRWIFFVNLPVFLLITIFSKQILRIIFGQEYVSASIPLGILAFGYLMYSLAHTSNNMLYMIKKTKIIFIIYLIYTGINLILNYILIPLYGINGAAIATSTSIIVGTLLLFLFNYKFNHLRPFRLSYLKPLFSALISIWIVYILTRIFFKVVLIYGFILMFMLFLLVYLGLLFLFRSFEKEDIEILRIIIDKFKISSKLKFFNFG
jgi:O-antigen/teichoic acid export membrane protein